MLFTSCKNKKISNSKQTNTTSNKFDQLYVDACSQYNLSNYSQAFILFKKCSELKPEEASVFFYLSKIKSSEKKYEESLNYASKAFKFAPENKFYTLHYAQLLKNGGDIELAQKTLLQTINKINPKEDFLYKELDQLYDINKKTEERISLWKQFEKANNGFHVLSSTKLIELYKSQKKYDLAHQYFESLKKASPRKTVYLLDQAKLYLEENKTDMAMQNYEKAMSINPNNYEVNINLYEYYKLTNKAKSEQYLLQAIKDGSTDFSKKVTICQTLYNQAKTDTSYYRLLSNVAYLIESTHYNNDKALFTSTQFYFTTANYSKTIELASKAISKNANFFDVWRMNIESHLKLNKTNEALTLTEQAIEIFPLNAHLYSLSATILNQVNQYDKAITNAERALKYAFEDSTKATAHYELSKANIGLKNYQQAKTEIDKSIQFNAKNANYFDLLGNIYYYLNDINKALEQWNKAKNMGLVDDKLEKKIKNKKVE